MSGYRPIPLDDSHDLSSFDCGTPELNDWLRNLAGRAERLGGVLLNAALDVIVEASSVEVGRLVVVDGIDEEAAAFYRHHEFRAVGGRRLAIKVESARKALGR